MSCINRKRVFISIICVVIIFMIGITTICLYPSVRIILAENKYLKSNQPGDLIYLSMLLVDTKKYDKIYQYLPKVIHLNNLEDEIDRVRLSEVQSFTTEDIYNSLLSESMFSYIYVDKYDEYLLAFPQLYEKLLESEEFNFWYQKLAKTDQLSKCDYEIIIKSLKEIAPVQPELAPENNLLIKNYLENLKMQQFAYQYMGNVKTSEEIEKNRISITNEYMENLEEIEKIESSN